MPSLDHFEAHIAVDSGRLPQYAVDKNVEEKTVTCWIPATAGQTFTVNWTRYLKDIEWTSCCDVFLDGVGLGGTTLKPGPPGTPFRNANRRSVISTAKGDDDPSKNDQGGEVRLEIHRIEDITRAYIENHNIICVIPGEPQLSSKQPEPSLQKPDSVGAQWKYGPGAHLNRIERIVTFIFKYRELDILNASGLVTEKAPSRRKRRLSISMPPPAAETQDGAIIKVEEEISSVSLGTDDSRELERSRKRTCPDPITTVENKEKASLVSSMAVESHAEIIPNAEEQTCLEYIRPMKRSRKRKPAVPTTVENSDDELWNEIKDMRALLDQLTAKAHSRKIKSKPKRVKTPARPAPGYLTRAVTENIAEQDAMMNVDTQTSGVESEPPKLIEFAIGFAVEEATMSKLRAWN